MQIKRVFILLLATSAMFIGCNNSVTNKVKVGVILPLTGVSAELGAPLLEAMKVAEDIVNEKLIASGDSQIELVFEDGKSTASGTITAFQRLHLTQPSSLIVFGDVPCSNLAANVSKHKYPTIALGVAADNILSSSDHFFRAWTTTLSSSEIITNYASTKLKAKTCGIFYVENNYGEEFSKSVISDFKKLGGDVVVSESYDISTVDVKNQVYKIIKANPEVVFILGYGQGYLAAINQLKTLGYKGKLITDETITIPAYIEATKNAVEGIIFCSTSFNPYEVTPENSTFLESYEKKVHALPNAHAVFSFASVEIIADAIRRSGSSREQIYDGLMTVNDLCTIIGNVSYLPTRELDVPIVVRQMQKDGTYTSIE